eukprot:Nk52_evm1s2431 gene=Nk52_evmTU1s2431
MKKKYKCAFPHARIKKIMQSDDEVGKVAKAAPILVSKALEMFMQALIDSAATYTSSRNAKTITPQHIKAAVVSDQRNDFLNDLVKDISLSSDIRIKKSRDAKRGSPHSRIGPSSGSASAAGKGRSRAKGKKAVSYMNEEDYEDESSVKKEDTSISVKLDEQGNNAGTNADPNDPREEIYEKYAAHAPVRKAAADSDDEDEDYD